MGIRNSVKKLPFPIKQGLKYAYGMIPLPIRYGRVFRDTYAFLQESQWWSREKLEEYQMQQLSKLLRHSYENVPYYRNIFDERGLKPGDIQDFDDLKKLPYLTKEIIRERLADLTAKNYPQSKLHYVTTGGTAGMPLGFYWEKGLTDPKEWAIVWRGWNWAGLNVGDKRAVLRGNVIRRFKNNKRRLWEYDPIDNALILSPYDMTNETINKYTEIINRFKPVAIQAYPSNLHILVHYLKAKNIKIDNVKCILTSSEVLYAHQRKFVEEYLGIKIFDHYGNTERNVLIMQCEKHNYHIISEYGVTEIVKQNGQLAQNEGEAGEIVGTGFNNYAMPFIRYRTGDIAVLSNDRCNCGREYAMLKGIEGRIQEFFVDKSGSLITFTCSDEVLWNVKDKINAYQYVQNDPGKVLLQIDAKNKFSTSDIKCIKRTFLEHYSRFDIEIIFVENIPRTKSGKYRHLIQNLQIDLG